jgi:hypothetical protein
VAVLLVVAISVQASGVHEEVDVDNEVVGLGPPAEEEEQKDNLGEAVDVGRRGGAFLSTTGSFTLSSGTNTAGNDEALSFELGGAKNTKKDVAGVKKLTDKYMAMAKTKVQTVAKKSKEFYKKAKKKNTEERKAKEALMSKRGSKAVKCDIAKCQAQAIQQGWTKTCDPKGMCADCTPCGMCENQASKKAGCYGTPLDKETAAKAKIDLPPNWSLESVFACSGYSKGKGPGKCTVSFAQMPRDARYVNNGFSVGTKAPLKKVDFRRNTPRVDGVISTMRKKTFKFGGETTKWWKHCEPGCRSCTAAINAQTLKPTDPCKEDNPAKCGWASSSCTRLHLYYQPEEGVTVVNPLYSPEEMRRMNDLFFMTTTAANPIKWSKSQKKEHKKNRKTWKKCAYVMVKWQFCRGPLAGGSPVCKAEKRCELTDCQMAGKGNKGSKLDLTKNPPEPIFSAAAGPYCAAM